jgi:hypothetical protein
MVYNCQGMEHPTPRFPRFATALFKRFLKEASERNPKKCWCQRLLSKRIHVVSCV